MDNRTDNFLEVKFKRKTYDIVSANTSFYQFLGERLYNTFEMLIPKEDKDILEAQIQEENFGQGFILHVSDQEGIYHEMAVCIKEWDVTDVITLQLTEISSLYHDNNYLKSEISDYTELLSQFNSIYYIYDRKTDELTWFQFKPNKNVIANMTLDKWYEKVKESLAESEKRKIDGLLSDFRNGIRSFNYYIAEADFFNMNSEKGIEICGTSIYDNGVHVKTIGNFTRSGAGPVKEAVRRDQLTGLILKEDITNYAKKRIDLLGEKTCIAIIDIDEFKSINDNFGHMKGDEVLRKCASIIAEEVEGFGNAGRIGGDEFFIVLDYLENKEDLRSLLRSIKNSILSAYSVEKDGFRISTSIGCAEYSDDTDSFNTLFLLADYLLYRAKNKGKNRYIIYNQEKHGTVEEILNQGIDNIGISSRKGLSKSEIICKIADQIFGGGVYPVENIFNDIVDYFGVERIVLYSKDCKQVLFQCGNKLMSEEQIKNTCQYIVDENLQKLYDKGVLVVNNVKMFDTSNHELYEKLQEQGVLSFMHHEITGKNNEKFIVSYESVVIRNTWNTEDMHFFRILDHILAKCL